MKARGATRLATAPCTNSLTRSPAVLPPCDRAQLAFGLKGKRPAAAAAVAAFGVDDDDEASEVDGATKRPKTDGATRTR